MVLGERSMRNEWPSPCEASLRTLSHTWERDSGRVDRESGRTHRSAPYGGRGGCRPGGQEAQAGRRPSGQEVRVDT